MVLRPNLKRPWQGHWKIKKMLYNEHSVWTFQTKQNGPTWLPIFSTCGNGNGSGNDFCTHSARRQFLDIAHHFPHRMSPAQRKRNLIHLVPAWWIAGKELLTHYVGPTNHDSITFRTIVIIKNGSQLGWCQCKTEWSRCSKHVRMDNGPEARGTPAATENLTETVAPNEADLTCCRGMHAHHPFPQLQTSLHWYGCHAAEAWGSATWVGGNEIRKISVLVGDPC